jgi:beta-lactamase regulating signal transducer with metallopeptidase domain
MSAMKNEILMACYQLIAAAVNGTYQGILITVLVAASLRMLRRTNAATRYAVWFGTLLLLALIIPAHCLRSRWDAGLSPATGETSVSALASQPDSDAMRMEASSLPRDSDGEADFVADAGFPENNPGFDAHYNTEQQYLDFAAGAGTNSQTSEDPVRAIVLALLEAAPPNQVDPTPEAGFLAGIKQKLSWLGERIVAPFPSWTIAPKTPLFVAAILPMSWLAIGGAKISFLIWQLFRIRKLKLNSVNPRPELNALFLSLRESLGARRNVTLRVSTDHRSPVVLGFFKPVILLPADAGLEASEHVLRHELAHVRRCDDWTNLVQHFIKALYFFHPAIWWVSKRISLEREIACDDQVLHSTRRPRAYALLLANLAGRMQATVLAPGVSTNQSQLKQRIDMILNSNRNTSPRLAKARLGLLATAAALLAMAAIYSAPRLAFAQSTDAAAPAAVHPPDAPGTATASAAPTPPFAVSEDGAPSVLRAAPSAAPAVSAGPKFKPGSEISIDVRPAIAPRPNIAILTAPSPGVAPVASVASVPVPVAPVTSVVPPVLVAPLVASADSFPGSGQPPTPRPAHRPGRDSSLEERLDRLEKMVESLVAQKKNPGQFEFSPKPPPGEMKFNWKNSPESANQWEQAQAEFGKMQAEFDRKRADMDKHLAELEKLKHLNDPKVSKEIKELAEQHAKMSVDQAKIARGAEQAAREAQRAARDAQRGRTIHKTRDGSHQELEALHKQHEMLEKQMEKLDRQIEKLEREQEQLEEQQENDEQDLDVQENQNDARSDQPSEPSNNNNFYPRQPAAK